VETETVCRLCPRRCGAARGPETGRGVCGMGTLPVLARAASHLWEEPCISGTRGSGAVFFSGCALGCVFCQNRAISAGRFGKAVTPARLREIFFELLAQGVHNINLVNPTHFADAVLEALEGGLPAPVVWNTGGYERTETLARLEGKVQIYLPDLKYALSEPARKYSGAADYPETAKAAILEMYRQTGPYKLDDDGLLRRGVVIRHLILPENPENTYRVIDWVAETFRPGQVLFSLMSQFTPMETGGYAELGRPITAQEHERALQYMLDAGIEDGYWQEPGAADGAFVPAFDLTGV